MSYMCDICGTHFEEPLIRKRHERLNGFLYSDEEALCPICAQPYFSKVDKCKCGGVKRIGDHLCKQCKKELLSRVILFFDGLTAEEEEQFDYWMDGDTITNRKAWV